MARKRKVRYQLLRNIVLGAVILIMLGALIGGAAQSVVIFMLTGRIDGTPFVVPVWGMFALYFGVAGFIGLLHFVDRELENQYRQKPAGRLPSRRYGHI